MTDSFEYESEEATPDVVVAEGSAPFASLVERAEAFVVGHGGRASEDLLISHVFGSSGSPALWRPLLRDVLAKHENLTLRADGSWFLANQQVDTAAPLEEFVVLDVETTGLQASRQRIIEIALVRMAHGQVVEQWESLCQPGRRVPAYITKLTGIDDERLDDAPAFGEVADAVLERLEGAVIVGHNVAFDISFLNEELKRIGRDPVVNEHLCTLSLATRLMPGLRKPTLHAVAQRLAVPGHSRHKHRAGSDARVTGLVACALLRQAADAGFTSLDELKPISRSATRRPKERMPRASAIADRSLLADVPKAPGVYLFRDVTDRVVYVGKAKNLRDRVGSYFSQPLGYTRKMDGLIEALKSIETVVVGSEIEALLLESQLIRRFQPRYNTALRSHEQYPFIRIDVANPWPRVSLAKARKDDGALYFGPYRSSATARKSVELINRVVPLRTCTRSFRDARSYGSPCIQLDIGQCMGPCVGRANRDEYMALVRRVVAYVDGQDDALHDMLWQGLESAAAALDFERAGRLRRDLNASLSLTAVQRRMRESTEAHWGLLVTRSPDAGSREVMLLVQGRVWAQFRVSRAAGAEDLADRLERSWSRFRAHGLGPLDHDSVDDLHILSSWLARHEGFPALIPLDDRLIPSWTQLATQVLALSSDDLDPDVWRKTRDAAPVEWEDALLEPEGDEVPAEV
ncbi:MAG: exonuclease domain-containing protein [Thermomicrobiales bacterium]